MAAVILFWDNIGSCDDRIWLNDTKVDGKPVKFVFDSGANAIGLVSGSVRRLGLRVNGSPTGGFRLTRGYSMEWGGRSIFTEFAILDFPDADFDGVMGWAPIGSSIMRIDANALKIIPLIEVPKEVGNWTEYRLMTNFGTLDIEIPHSDGTKGVVSFDTGSDGGLALSANRWLEWKEGHPHSPATIEACMTLKGLVSEEESWADKIHIGPLVITDVPITEEHTPIAIQWGAKHDATLGLAALSRLDIIVDGIHSIAYLRARDNPPLPYAYNRLGADFAPAAEDASKLVATVASGGPAYRSGIRNGDILMRVDRIHVTGWADDWESRFRLPPGTRVNLELQRNNTNFETTAVLREILHPGREFHESRSEDESTNEAEPNLAGESNGTDVENQIAGKYYNVGTSELTNGNLDAARTNYSKAIEIKSDFPEAYAARGYVEQNQGKVDIAISDYDKAIDLQPGFAAAYGNRGAARQHKGDLKGALADYNKAIALEPESAEYYAYRGSLEEAAGKMDSALSDDDRAIELDPKSAEAYGNRSGVEAIKGDLAPAEADCAEAAALDSNLAPEAAQIFKTLGWSRYGLQEYTNALSDFQRACKFNPSDGYAHFGLWLSRSRLGQNGAATDALREYLANRQVEHSDDWPSKIGEFLSGEITDVELLGAAGSADAKTDLGQHCEAYFYIGSKHLVAGDKAGAAADFRKCVATGVQSFSEYQCAKTELKNIEDAH